MQNFIIKNLVDKATDDIKKLRNEAKKRDIESQIPRWITNYMAGLQKTNKEAHSIVSDLLEARKI